VRYWDDATIDGNEDKDGTIFGRDGNYWVVTIELETGRVVGWPEGVIADIHYKVCDDGEYSLLNEAGGIVLQKEGYVPRMMCPKENGYGDYIIMDINEEGFIQSWEPDLSYFQEEQD